MVWNGPQLIPCGIPIVAAIEALVGDDMPNATPRVRDVAAVSRDDVDMQVENGLTGGLA
jgi:hypothetical protein